MLRTISVFVMITVPLGAQAIPHDAVIRHFEAITTAMTANPDDVQKTLVDTKIAIDRYLPDIDEDGLRLIKEAEGIVSAAERVAEVGEALDAMKEPLQALRSASAALNERSRGDELRAMRIDVFTRLQRLDDLIKALVRPLLGIETASRFIADAERISERLCDCDSKACVNEVLPELESFRERWTRSRANDNTREAVDTAIKKAGQCLAERHEGLSPAE